MEAQNERQGLIIGRNAVAEALKSGRAIDSLLVAKGERGGSVGKLIGACQARRHGEAGGRGGRANRPQKAR